MSALRGQLQPRAEVLYQDFLALTTLASLMSLAVGTGAEELFGAIALATTGGMIAGTVGALFVVPALLVGRGAPPRRREA